MAAGRERFCRHNRTRNYLGEKIYAAHLICGGASSSLPLSRARRTISSAKRRAPVAGDVSQRRAPVAGDLSQRRTHSDLSQRRTHSDLSQRRTLSDLSQRRTHSDLSQRRTLSDLSQRRVHVAVDLSPTARSKLLHSVNHNSSSRARRLRARHHSDSLPDGSNCNRTVSFPDALAMDRGPSKATRKAGRSRGASKLVRGRGVHSDVRPSGHNTSAIGLNQVIALMKTHQPSLVSRAAWLLEHHRGRETELVRKLREGGKQRSILKR